MQMFRRFTAGGSRLFAAYLIVFFAFAGTTLAQTDLPSMMGGGNIENGISVDLATSRFKALNSVGTKNARFAVYGYWDNNAQTPRAWDLDWLVKQANTYGVTPQLIFEYDSSYFTVPIGGYNKWYQIGRAHAERFRPNSPWLQSQGIYNWGLTVYSAINEPDLYNNIPKQAYHDALKGLADGVHSIDSSLKIIPGGFMSPNAYNEHDLRGYGAAIADLMNDGTLDGIDLHMYHSYWAPLSNYSSSSQSKFEAVKIACGFTRDINFYTTEHNYNRHFGEGGGSPQEISEDEAARRFLTNLWDQLGVVGNNGQSVTKLALVWSIFLTYPYPFALAYQLDPWTPTRRGQLYELVAKKTAGMNFTSLDPKGTGEYVLSGGGKKMWVWQNRPGWTNHPGTSFTVSGIPGGATQLEVYKWDGLNRTISVSGQSSYTVTGLPSNETLMFLVNAEGGASPQPTPAPPPASGSYFEIVARHSGKCLDVSGVSSANGANVIQWDCHGGTNQQWQRVTVGGGYERLVARHSGKVLDVSGISTANFAAIHQWDYAGGANQQWLVESVGGGYYKITARHTGKALDVNGVSTSNGAQVIQYDYNTGGNQQWLLRAIP